MFKFMYKLLWSPLRMIEAAEALHTPPLTNTARRYYRITLGCLFANAAMLVPAAVINAFFRDLRPLDETLGWIGIGLLLVTVYNGLRYKVFNQLAFEEMLAEGGHAKELGRLSVRELSVFCLLRRSDQEWQGNDDDNDGRMRGRRVLGGSRSAATKV